MDTWIKILVGLSAVIHLGILILQMFRLNQESVEKDYPGKDMIAIFARNQGLYNGFIAAGLIWGLFKLQTSTIIAPTEVLSFFLIFIAIAGVYGSLSIGSPKAFLLQTVPAVLALVLFWFVK